jgi:predicted transcriptional regulator
VVNDGRIAGVAPRDYAVAAPEIEQRGWHVVADIMRRDFVVVRDGDLMSAVVAKMHRPHAAIAVVTRKGGSTDVATDAVGIITWERVAEILEESLDFFT